MITIDVTHYINYLSALSIGAVASIFETNKTEAWDAIKLLYPIAIPCFILTSLIVGLSIFELHKVKQKMSPSFVTIGVCLFIVCSLFYIISKGGRNRIIKDIETSPTLAVQLYLGYRMPLVINQNMTIAAYLIEMYKFRSEIKKTKNLPKGITLQKTALDETPKSIFVVIGESSLQTHYSLYGYDLPTTPFLINSKNLNILHYYNAISSAPITREALTLSLTFASPSNKTPLFRNKNVVSLAQDAGYKTYWISNQDKVGMYDSYIGLIASQSNLSEFHNFNKDDLELVDIVNYLYNPNEKQAFFIHLKGSHLAYDDKFDINDTIKNERKETSKYDRSIHHTDRVLMKLYNNTFMQDTTHANLLYYYSDHGEIINKGHGFKNDNKNQFQIPFLSISQSLTYETDSIIKKYINGGKLNSSTFIYILAESMGYTIQDSIISKAKHDAMYYLDVDGQYYPISKILN